MQDQDLGKVGEGDGFHGTSLFSTCLKMNMTSIAELFGERFSNNSR